jgi:hypothetical protein
MEPSLWKRRAFKVFVKSNLRENNYETSHFLCTAADNYTLEAEAALSNSIQNLK